MIFCKFTISLFHFNNCIILHNCCYLYLVLSSFRTNYRSILSESTGETDVLDNFIIDNYIDFTKLNVSDPDLPLEEAINFVEIVKNDLFSRVPAIQARVSSVSLAEESLTLRFGKRVVLSFFLFYGP